MNIKKIIREEMNDFEWANGQINPWYEYDGIIFDIEPTREDVNQYIEQCLTTRDVNNAHEWTGETREDDINEIIATAYLGLYGDHISNNNLGYPSEDCFKSDNTILYSTLKG